MQTSSFLFQLGLALAIGMLVGTERHWRDRGDAPGMRTAGIRTFGIIGLLGGLTGTIADAHNLSAAILIGAVFIAFSAVFGLFKWREKLEEHSFSVTTVVAGQATFLLGVLAALDEPVVAAGAAIALTLVLASREYLHTFVERLTWPELRSAILLLAMAFIILPLLPDHPLGPYDAINPAQIWVFAIALAGVSFAGYIATRVFGSRHGPLIAGIAGGLVSSTAVALTSARQSISYPEKTRNIAAGALAASAISVARGIVLVILFAPTMLMTLLPPLGSMVMILTVAAFICTLQTTKDSASDDQDSETAKSPFDIGSVLKLASIIALATIGARVGASILGDRGIVLASIITGLVDIDSAILAITRFSAEAISAGTLELSILLAIATNMVAKMAYSLALGTRSYGALIAVVSCFALAVAALVAMVALV